MNITTRHPSQYVVIGNKITGEKLRFNPFDKVNGGSLPNGYYKVTSCMPIPENLKKYWFIPIYTK